MEANAKRTLVKSAPELWELADDLARMEAWMAGFVGVPGEVRVEVTERVPGRVIAWRALPSHGAHTVAVGFEQLSIKLAEKGLGTSVSVSARHALPDPADAVAALERLLDELAAPERRPFSRG